jgi:hypothetical protein
MRRVFFGIRFVLSDDFGNFLERYLFHHFFRDNVPKREVFKFLNQFTHFNHFCFKHLSWIQGSEAAGQVSSMAFFKKNLEDKDKRFKTNLTLSLILRFNQRLVRYSIGSVSLIAPHIKDDLTTSWGMSTSQPRCSQGSTQKTPSRWSLEELKDAFRSTWMHAVLDYEELGGLSGPRPRDYAHGVYILG